MSLRCRIIGFIIGVIALVWAFVGPAIMPGAHLTMAECWAGGLAGAVCVVLSLIPWRCLKCHGDGTMPSAVLSSDGLDILPATATCNWCGGDGKGRL